MKLEGKTDYFEYLPGESVLVAPGETMVIDFLKPVNLLPSVFL